MARTFVWRSAVLAAAAGIFGCGSENIITPGRCPALCPSGNVVLADTLLVAPDTADTSARGFVTVDSAAFLLVSSLDSLKSVALIRFEPIHPDTFRIGTDTTPHLFAQPPDSVQVIVHIGQRDTSVKNVHLVLYRLPAKFDTTMTYAQAQPYFADSLVLDTAAVPDSLVNGDVIVPMPDSLRAPPADSGVISLGVKIVADTATALGIASGKGGSANPRIVYFMHGQAPLDTVKRAVGEVPAFDIFVQSPDPAQVPPGVLAVGGLPTARSALYLALPKIVVDSTSVVRATLILNTVRPVTGFSRDSFYVEARPLLRDYGFKSILFPDSSVAGRVLVHVGQTGAVKLDIALVLRLWGTTLGDTLPRVLALKVYQPGGSEGGVLGRVDFAGRAAGAAGGAPQLQVTYVKKYEFGVP